ncbi:hypothetical protein EDD75_0003 [Thermodesulfitimonas autotrophica]|uniref:Uncharacterized protein n=1 Tax=Thermodesulfitimonas autotrophica TaxID=1894989 RepID=A0A3N5AVY9_9THEO|nr:hypothetical protein [Thermodesulfitimonas autotrophica]RPF49199.1 hypothetical protein EDD75_0003 [Thermodesulfitimonas autotrophica]
MDVRCLVCGRNFTPFHAEQRYCGECREAERRFWEAERERIAAAIRKEGQWAELPEGMPDPFQCSCGRSLKLPAPGERVACPRCGKVFSRSKERRPLRFPPGFVSFRCACGKELVSPGGLKTCPSCLRFYRVAEGKAALQEDGFLRCPVCGRVVTKQPEPEAVYACVWCRTTVAAPRETEKEREEKLCPDCNEPFAPANNRQERCPECAKQRRRAKQRELMRKRRAKGA